MSEANERLFLFQPALWKSANPTHRRMSSLLPSRPSGLMEVRNPPTGGEQSSHPHTAN